MGGGAGRWAYKCFISGAQKENLGNEACARRERDEGHPLISLCGLWRHWICMIFPKPCLVAYRIHSTFRTLRICVRTYIRGGFVKPPKSTRPYSHLLRPPFTCTLMIQLFGNLLTLSHYWNFSSDFTMGEGEEGMTTEAEATTAWFITGHISQKRQKQYQWRAVMEGSQLSQSQLSHS